MTPSEYLRRRDIITWKAATNQRGSAWGKRALAALNKRADIDPIIRGHKIVGHQFSRGAVCLKQRFITEQLALQTLARIAREPDARRKPIRAFYCTTCGGWHVTSQQHREAVTCRDS